MVPRLLKGPFTVADYHRMAETGLLRPDARVELLDGQVVEMSPIGSRHAGCVNRLTRMLIRAVGDRATVATQNPAVLDDFSEPQPDVAVMRYRPDGYAARHPEPADVLLLIEVMVTSHEFDRDVKVPLYSRAGIPEVWLVDLEARAIDVYREPGEEGYAVRRRATGGDSLTPLRLPDVAFSASDILD
ncbi:MAG: Uma2 family endonuclease [Solirubrobacterales bacterium]